MNWSLFINLFDNHKVKINILNTLVINLGLINQFYGLSNMDPPATIWIIFSLGLISIYSYVNQSMTNLSLDVLIKANQSIKEL